MTARSYLYVPGDRKDMLVKAAGGGADAIIADLEDGVAFSAKDEARRTVSEWVAETPAHGRLWVRVNNETDRIAEDIEAAITLGVAGIYLPKATPDTVAMAADHVTDAARRKGLDGDAFAIIALIESAVGLARVQEIASALCVSRLAIGEADLGADLGLDSSLPDAEWLPIRLQLVVASAAAGLDSPVGPVLTDFRNDSRLRESTAVLNQIGFGARAAIHPRQVAVINDVFAPTAEELAAARDLLARYEGAQAAGKGVMISDDGTMADEATVRHARRILGMGAES